MHACAQTSRGSKRSAEALVFEHTQGGLAEEDEAAKRAKTGSGRLLSEEEKLERRCPPCPMFHAVAGPPQLLPSCVSAC